MSDASLKCITPFIKQGFVTLGVALNMLQLGLVMGLSTSMVPQLQEPTSSIPIDDNYGSWIAAIPGFTFLVGNLITPSIMDRFGRKIGNISSLAIFAISWTCIIFAFNITILLIARSLQGIGMGMTTMLSPVSVGEYTSPKSRGVFLMSLSVAISIGVLTIHIIGLYLNWVTVAVICVAITAVDIVIIMFSPESPSWLASKGRYEDCKRTFHWLRGDAEEEELEKLIETSIASRKYLEIAPKNAGTWMLFKTNFEYFTQTIQKAEFYKPIIIMMHIYTIAQWSGVNIFVSHAIDLIHMMVDEEVNVSLMIITFDVQRTISNTVALILIKHMKRKTMFLSVVCLNLLALIASAAYVYAKTHSLLSFDSIYIGLALAHIHMFSIAIGAIPLSLILAGEIFPLQNKGLAGGISAVTYSVNIFTCIKVAPFLFKSIGLYGAYLLYSGIIVYCLVVVGLMLPETKDRTLQDIEEDFKRKSNIKEKSEKCVT